MRNCEKAFIVLGLCFSVAVCFSKGAQKAGMENPPQDEAVPAAGEQSPYPEESQNSKIPFVKCLSIADPDYTFSVEKDEGYYKFYRKNALGVVEQTYLYGSHFYPYYGKRGIS